MKLAIILILALLALGGSASAELVVNSYTNGFGLSTQYNEQIKMCSCEARIDKVLVSNSGQFASSFRATVSSQYQSVHVLDGEFTLKPGEFKELSIVIDGTCGIQGVFDYNIIVENSFGRVQRLTRTIRIDKCQTSALDVQPQSVTAGLCKPATYVVNMTNVGTYPDAYTIDLGPFNRAASFSQQSVLLLPGQSYSQNVSVTLDCSDFGTKSIPFTVLTGKNGAGATAQRELIIPNQFNFEMQIPEAAQVCLNTTSAVPLRFSNNAEAEDQITISVTGPGSTPDTISLGPKQNVTSMLELNPESAGTHIVTVTANDPYGVSHAQQLAVQALNCYDPQLKITDGTGSTVSFQENCCGTRTLQVNVKNNGDRRQEFLLSVDGPSNFKLAKQTVTLNPKENTNIELAVTLPCIDDNFTATITVWLKEHPETITQQTITFASLSRRSCTMVEIDNDERSIRMNDRQTGIIVTNTGKQAANYSITPDGGIFRIAEEHVALEPGASKELTIISSANLQEQQPGRYVMHPTFTTDGISYTESVGITLRESTLWSRFVDWIRSLRFPSLCVLALALLALIAISLLALLIFRYAGAITFSDGMTRSTLTMLKVLLIAAVLILALALFILPVPRQQFERQASTADNPVEWYQGANKTISLSTYIDEPSRNIIRYRVETAMPYDLRGDTLLLRPNSGFAGNVTLQIVALDARGEEIVPSSVQLSVIAVKQLSAIEKIESWCKHIAVALCILIVLLTLLLVLSVPERRTPTYSKNVLVVVKRKTVPKKSVPRKQAIVREFRGSGKTVNIALSVPQQKTSIAPDTVYVGSTNGDKVHTPTCVIAMRIPKGKRISYSSKRDAVKAKLVPCKVCRPFEGGM